LIKLSVAEKYKQQLRHVMGATPIFSDKGFKNNYRQFLTTVVWIREDPMQRMFEPEFKESTKKA
jgi:hypothetical protein